jgi:hypothetical protein
MRRHSDWGPACRAVLGQVARARVGAKTQFHLHLSVSSSPFLALIGGH